MTKCDEKVVDGHSLKSPAYDHAHQEDDIAEERVCVDLATRGLGIKVFADIGLLGAEIKQAVCDVVVDRYFENFDLALSLLRPYVDHVKAEDDEADGGEARNGEECVTHQPAVADLAHVILLLSDKFVFVFVAVGFCPPLFTFSSSYIRHLPWIVQKVDVLRRLARVIILYQGARLRRLVVI